MEFICRNQKLILVRKIKCKKYKQSRKSVYITFYRTQYEQVLCERSPYASTTILACDRSTASPSVCAIVCGTEMMTSTAVTLLLLFSFKSVVLQEEFRFHGEVFQTKLVFTVSVPLFSLPHLFWCTAHQGPPFLLHVTGDLLRTPLPSQRLFFALSAFYTVSQSRLTIITYLHACDLYLRVGVELICQGIIVRMKSNGKVLAQFLAMSVSNY